MSVTQTEKLLCELIALPSVNPAFLPADDPRAGERRVAEFLAATAGVSGLDVDFQKVTESRSNMLARYVPSGPIRRRVLLAPHMDTVGGDEKERQDQAWIVGENGGVENVVIFLSISEKQYFDLPAELRDRKDTVFVDQPHCAFVPHIQAAFPEYSC